MCSITYDSLILDEIAQTVTLSGTAVDCNKVAARIKTFTNEKTDDVNANGDWTIVFTDNDFLQSQSFDRLKRECGTTPKIGTHCVDKPECQGPDVFLLDCAGCPGVKITIEPGDCVNCRRTVHFSADVVSAGDATYTWFFGTDEDNQPGEDSQAGDGSGENWLPAPNTNGVRVVETDHVYDRSDQSQDITVKLVTSSGPNSICRAEQKFTLDPCLNSFTVSLQVLNPQDEPIPTTECLTPGYYTVEVTSPTDNNNNIDYTWSVNGTEDDSQKDPTFSFRIVAGEEKTITVDVVQGGCDGSNGVAIIGCEDCSDYAAELRVLGDNRRDVTAEDCLQPGDYTVEATSPGGTGNTFSWQVNNEEVATPTPPAFLQVHLGDDDEKIVTLEASRGECSDTTTVVLRTCPPPPPDVVIDLCVLFRVFFLIGLGLLTLGAAMFLCPAFSWFDPATNAIVAGVIAAIGAVLFLVFFPLWLFICKPSPCDWLLVLWQALALIGAVFTYTALCPGCIYLGFGVLGILAGIGVFIWWVLGCKPTLCRMYLELLVFVLFVLDVVSIIQIILGGCVLTNTWYYALIWAAVLIGLKGIAIHGLARNQCNVTFEG